VAVELSAVMIAGSIRERADLCLSRLLAQTALDRMEIVLVDLGTEGPPRGSEHTAVRYIRRPDLHSYSMAQAECVRQARGEIIAFIEDHCYPSPGWAAYILQAFREPHVQIVTYGFVNYNPERYLSRGFFMTEYGRWMRPVSRGPISIPSCNNVAYRRTDLEPLLGELDKLFDVEFVMQRRILARGGVAWMEPAAEAAHENWETLGAGLSCNYSHRRLNAARRAEAGGWSLPRKWFFAGATAATPLLHLSRLAVSLWNRPSLWLAFVEALPVSTAVYVATAYAEILGYLFGPASSREKFTLAELSYRRRSGRSPRSNQS
jgi:hypothetical protein